MVGSGVHAVMGTGGAPEGVLTAAAMRCLNGEIFARLVVSKPEHEARCRAMGITDFKKIYRSKDLAPGENIIFAATGVTDGTLMRGVRFFGDGTRTSSVIMQNDPHRIRFIDSIHVAPGCRRRRSGSDLPAEYQSRARALATRPDAWQRNVYAVTAASFMGYTGFTLVMPFLPLFIGQLGVTDVGDDRDVDRRQPRRHAGAHGAAVAGVGTARRSLRPQDHGRAIAGQLRRADGGDGLRHAGVARVRAARGPGTVCRLRIAVGRDGGRVGAARSHAEAIGLVQTAQRIGPASVRSSAACSPAWSSCAACSY